MAATVRPSYLSLCCQEPFRLFFPLGLLIGISGVSLWPLFFSGLHKFYPGIMHARMMIEGFMTAFVIGFLGTAAPRLTGTASFSRGELAVLTVLLLISTGLHIGHQHTAGDLTFLSLLLFFLVRLWVRFIRRMDLPPPSFVLVAFGFINAIVGTALVIAGPHNAVFARAALLGTAMLQQAFLLHLILGVGAFLLPRFLSLPAKPELPESPDPTPEWTRRALFAAAVGVALFISYCVEVFASASQLAGLIRFATAAIFLAVEVPIHRSTAPGVTITRSLHASIILLVFGLLFPIVWPIQRVAGLHIIFIGGFTLITLTVATRVVLGHTGQSDHFHRPLPFLRLAVLMLVLGTFLRVMGDFYFTERRWMLDAASYLWMVAAAIWGIRVLPRVRLPDAEEQ